MIGAGRQMLHWLYWLYWLFFALGCSFWNGLGGLERLLRPLRRELRGELAEALLRLKADAEVQAGYDELAGVDRAKKGKRLTGVGLYRVVRNLGQDAGLKVGPHGLRHTAITGACKAVPANRIGLEEVVDFSRHSRKSIAILMVYRDREVSVQGQLASLVSAGA